MSQPPLWERIKRARVVQVLLVYMGASWVVLQIAEILAEALSLPEWVMPVAVILLLVGLVVILSTAWIQSMPSTTAREASGEIPSDWEIAPGEALASVMKGRLPHLTWGRTILGGIVALSLLFGGTGLYVGFTGRSLGLGPTEAGASGAAEGIAVVPFEVRGADLEIWREGMMDLLSNNLDGVGGFRTIDARTVMARWQEEVGEGSSADLDATLRAAARTNARYALTGSVVGLGRNVRLTANMYDLDTGEEVAQGQSEGSAEEVLALVDELAVATMRDLLGEIGREGAGDLQAETLTTNSLPALRAFLEGEAHYRKGRFADAVQSFERAVAEDTTFAIALVRLSEAYGWLEDQSSERMQEYGERAMAHVDRLSPRYQFIMEAWDALNHGTAEGMPVLKEAVQKYPDDPEAWFLLAETYIHIGPPTYGTDDDLWQALEKSVALDPNFAPYLTHVAEQAILRDDRARAEETLARYEALTGNRDGLEHIELAIPLLLGDSAEAAAALEEAAAAGERTLSRLEGTFARRHDRWDRMEPLQTLMGEAQGTNRDAFRAYYAAGMGELERGERIITRASVVPSARGIYRGHVHELWGVLPPAGRGDELDPAICEDPAPNPTCHSLVVATLAREGNPAFERSTRLFRARADSLRDENPESAEALEAMADVAEGIALWRTGDRREGRRILERYTDRAGLAGERARLEMGWLEIEEGRPAAAVRHFRSMAPTWARPAALRGLIRAHAELGETEEVLTYQRSLERLTRNGDDLPPIVEARAAVRR